MATGAGGAPHWMTKASTRVHDAHTETTTLDVDIAAEKKFGALLELSAIDETKAESAQSVYSCADGSSRERRKTGDGACLGSSDLPKLQQQGCRSRQKVSVKSRLRALADRYVSCLHAIDGSGDMRGNMGGGHAFVYRAEPFRTDVTTSD